jgi:hypothetical protein
VLKLCVLFGEKRRKFITTLIYFYARGHVLDVAFMKSKAARPPAIMSAPGLRPLHRAAPGIKTFYVRRGFSLKNSYGK